MNVRAEETTPLLLVFRAGERDFAFPVEEVDEVVRMVALSPLPDAPACLLGVMNLRGRVVPVIDLACRLGLPATDPGIDARIMIIRRGEAVAGGIASRVREALVIPDECSVIGSDRHDQASQPARNVARVRDELIPMLDIGVAFGDVLRTDFQTYPEPPNAATR